QEYVSGQSLQECINRNGALPIKQVGEILWQVSSALACAAEAGIVHRDIKPDNILLGNTGEVKVADFGLARVVDTSETADLALTQAGMTLGTPLYMSPEQAQGKPLDHRSDQYSLGVTCYHALTGQPPFRGDTALAVALQHVNAKAENLEKVRPDIPPLFAQVIHRMLEKEPEKRFPNFPAIQEELYRLFVLSLKGEDEHSFAGFISKLTGWSQFRSAKKDDMLIASTEKLQRIMEKEKNLQKNGIRFTLYSLLSVLLVLFGSYAAGFLYSYSQPPLFTEPKPVQIEKFPTVEEQWIYACYHNTPDAWYAVIDYFPEEEYLWGRKAKRQLIRYYFLSGENGDSISPLPLFQEFASYGDFDVDEQALGLAGLAWCAAESGDVKKAQEYLQQLYALPVSYSDPVFLQILDAVNAAVQRKGKTEKM
ncbi:MAG: serine/threonine protein kinase, partial [Planctomycetaceae bacterium]|nr:serine/threonine protein kinase [Planctomycetaceae bacterium]